MAANLTSYGGLLNGTLSWLGRASPGEAIITPRFDDILLMAERRIYYGYATEDVGNPLRSDPLRIPEMEVVDPAFLMTGDAEVVRVDEGDVDAYGPNGLCTCGLDEARRCEAMQAGQR